MSPEQALGREVDGRSDLFSLGSVLYALCTGWPPFRAVGTHAVLKRVIDASPRPIREVNNEIPDWLETIIAKLHAKKPEDRFQTAKEVAEVLGQALAHAHEQGMVHRDIKPSNMLLTADRKIKILDLGLGVLMEADNNATFATADGIAVGTVDYMSPEQALGREVDGRADLFSLGCSMFHLMTGKLAYPGESPIDRLGRRISARPTPITDLIPDFPSAAARVLDKLTAPKPQDRFASAREAAEALQSVLRPKSRSTTARSSVSQVEESPPAKAPISLDSIVITPPASPVALAPRPLVEAGKPHYPSWFSPLASAAERRPVGLLLGLIAVLLLVFSAGAGLGYLVR